MMIFEILGFILAMALGIYFFGFVIEGIRTGRIRHTDATSTFHFGRQPFRFIFVAIVLALFGGIAFYYATRRAIAIFHGFFS
ncbi:MAG: hypothetical protein LBU11_12710 [Zoogloeaceae bacterium]|jgi:hypothetical protein|nr:hypothetical protein [Zoogloeaceae bacterium]